MEINPKDLIKIMSAILISGIARPTEKDAKIAIEQASFIFNEVENHCTISKEIKL